MNAPEPQGKEIDMCMFVDSDHPGDKVSCRSRSGFLIYINTDLLQQFSKKQSTVETTPGFVAIKQGIGTLRGLRYKLRMMSIPISGTSYIYRDNMSSVHFTSKPVLLLRKKSNFFYHVVLSQLQGVCPKLYIYPAKKCLISNKSHTWAKRKYWSAIFFMIFLMTISYQYQSTETAIRQ